MTMAVGAKAGEESLEDLLGFLERQRSEKLAEEADPRPQKGPRIPKLKDRWRPQWSPPLDKRNLTKESGEEVQPAWLRVCRSAGEAFHANPGYLKPKQLEPRVTERLTMPDRSFAHLPSQIKFSHDEPLPAPTDALCGEMHRRWLQKHGKARDRHLHEVYYALNRVDKAQEILDADARRMEIARDMISQGPIDRPHLSKAARSGIKKVPVMGGDM
ncbi:unnamed protein product [Effrenium voratum]|nr:unnamed protein product [Effrenium voratum]